MDVIVVEPVSPPGSSPVVQEFAEHLTRMLRYYEGHYPGSSLTNFCYLKARPLIIVCLGFHIPNFLAQTSFSTLRFNLGLYVCFSACIVMERLDLLQQCFRDLIGVIKKIEQIVHPTSLDRMARRVQLFTWIKPFYVVYGLFVATAVNLTVLVVDPLPCYAMGARALTTVLPDKWSGENAEVFLANLFFWINLPVLWFIYGASNLCFWSLILTVVVLTTAQADLYDAVGRHLQAGPCSVHNAAVLTMLINATCKMNAACADALPHLFLALFILPILSTVETVTNGVPSDIFSLSMVPLLLIVVLPLCMSGDFLEESRIDAAQRAGWGPWLEERCKGRLLRLSAMQAAEGNKYDRTLRSHGLGIINIRFFSQGVEVWFKFLQLFLNIQ